MWLRLTGLVRAAGEAYEELGAEAEASEGAALEAA